MVLERDGDKEERDDWSSLDQELVLMSRAMDIAVLVFVVDFGLLKLCFVRCSVLL